MSDISQRLGNANVVNQPLPEQVLLNFLQL